ncbi:hypothetical protein Tco_0440808, partial [Tanacetum coccineum]
VEAYILSESLSVLDGRKNSEVFVGDSGCGTPLGTRSFLVSIDLSAYWWSVGCTVIHHKD